ncbi:hypothetical protein CQR79_05310 [Aggregatibacter actinomycetemcomitans]|uniref:Uncharacterized protein n=1 Tax=Aggregatibacter actinomycetemcomitans TaxID=714 RepID=A0A2G1DQP6_AGGAC|nr:hypothetical protein [Aggregatibacter actinomycetemcomitans]PHO20813.1 hypothetical protein CQR80_04790 [Aggregatibacter actinomycetemcomitans]PHO22960.1 hypothetical protein CQR79_05310 [Aggregatibacter actinomycetemcomitans]
MKTEKIEMANNKTHGEKLVGIDFNVGNRGDVHDCKQRFAEAINQLETHRAEAFEQGTLTADKEMLLDEAQKRIIDAQMWAVKAITWGL